MNFKDNLIIKTTVWDNQFGTKVKLLWFSLHLQKLLYHPFCVNIDNDVCEFFSIFKFRFLTGMVLTKESKQKHAYSNILKILPPKNDFFFSGKNSDSVHISAQNIDCGCSLEPPRRGGSKDCPQSMFSSRNKNNNVYPC